MVALHTLRAAKAERVIGLYVILDWAFLHGRDEVDVAQQAIAGGARVLQLRDKERDKGFKLISARRLQALCTERGVLFIMNDDVDVAMAAHADGVHVGQTDLPLVDVRRLVPETMLIGVSTNNGDEALLAQSQGADYVAVGAIFPTGSKRNTRSAGPDTIRRVHSVVNVPIVAIGGINAENVGQVVQAGASAAAVISAVIGEDDVRAAAQRLSQAIQAARSNHG